MKGRRLAAISRRTVIVGGGIAGAGAVLAATLADGNAVSLASLRRPGDADDTAAFRRAAASGRPIYAPAGKGSGPGGRYVIGSRQTDNLPSGLTLYGDGQGKTVLRIAEGPPFLLHCDSGSPDPARNITGLRFRDLTFESNVAERGFAEFQYLVMLSGVTDVRFDRVGFVGFRGDGLHLGSSFTGSTERHNRDVVVADCLFDGVNANNRNAISIIDAERLTIERSTFLDCTRVGDGTANAGDPFKRDTGLGMPGPIDIEPNADKFAIVRDVTIRGNRFRGGGGFAVALHPLPNDFVTHPQRGIRVIDNIIEDRVGGIDMTGYVYDVAMKPGSAPYDVTISGNVVTRCKTPFRISGVRGMTMTGNRFVDCTDRAEFNNTAPVAEVTATRNRFERVGSDAFPYGLWLRTLDGLTLAENDFIDCGGPGRKDGVAIAIVAGSPRDLMLKGNRFSSPTGRMNQTLQLFRDAALSRRQVTLSGNVSTLTGPTMTSALALARP